MAEMSARAYSSSRIWKFHFDEQNLRQEFTNTRYDQAKIGPRKKLFEKHEIRQEKWQTNK